MPSEARRKGDNQAMSLNFFEVKNMPKDTDLEIQAEAKFAVLFAIIAVGSLPY